MMRATLWERYLTSLCLDRWSLDPASTIQLMKGIDSLATPGAADVATVAAVLERGGVEWWEARSVAPTICRALSA